MEIKRQMDPHKRKMIQIAAGAGILLLLAVMSGFILSYAQKSARDTQRLSDVARLRLDLERFYHKYNKFPMAISTGQAAGKDACRNDLCLEYVPVDPLSGIMYSYAPCADLENANCGENQEYAQSYMLIYTLETGSTGLPVGNHYASPLGICADPSCPGK